MTALSPVETVPFSVRDELRGARILVVGGTGFLGKVWLSLLLARVPDIGKIYLVVRSKKGVSSDTRFWADVASSHPFDPVREQHPGDAYEAFLRDKVVCLDADVGRPLCGVAGELLRELSGTIDAVVNVAGVVDFNPPLDEALSANAFGVQNLVELARALGDVPIMHTSTCFVAGYRNGQIDEVPPEAIPFPKHGDVEAGHWDPAKEIAECLDIIEQANHRADDAFRQSAFLAEAKENLVKKGEPARGSALEDELARVRRKFIDKGLATAGIERSRYWGWPNTYTYTKSIGEQMLSGSGLRYAIVRPSVIECSVAYPFAGWNEGISTMAPLIFMVLKGHVQVGTGDKTNLDVIPVDYVSAGMIITLAALLAKRSHEVSHLGVSDTNPIMMRRIVELTGLYKRKHFLAKGTGNPALNQIFAHIEPVGLPPKQFYQTGALAIAKHARSLSGLLQRAGVGPLASVLKPAAKAVSSYASLAHRVGLIWELFLPFMGETEYYFQTHHIRELYAAMTQEERALFAWYPETIDWRHYLLDVQYPGLEKWVNPAIEEKLKRPQQPLRAHDSLVALLEEQAAQHDLAVALQRFEPTGLTRITFRDLLERAECTAARLVALGVGKGDRVVLSGDNHPDWPIAYFGILRAGATAVPVDPALLATNLANVLRASQAKIAIFDEKLVGKAGAEALREVPSVKLLDLHAVAAFDGTLEPPVIERIAASDVASLIYTSGTTGTPKGVMLTRGNFTALIAALAPVFPLGKLDRTLSVLPLHHTFEFTCGLLLPLSRGARVVYLDELNGDRLAKAMKETRVTAMVGVPALWQLLERRILTQVEERGAVVEKVFDVSLMVNRLIEENTGLDLGRVLFGPVHGALGGNIRYLISGGAALPPSTAKLFAGLGLPLAEGYGLTEASPVLTVAKRGSKPGSVGKPVPGVEIRIEAPNAEGVGEVWARGANVMLGYAGDQEATDQVLTADGWLRTGDLGKLDRKGSLSLAGREKDVIVGITGENLYPDDIERALGAVPFVEEYSVLGILDEKGGEQAALIGVPQALENATPAEWGAQRDRASESLRAAVARLPVSQRPAVVLVYDAKLPRTATRKVKRNEVKLLVERLVLASAVHRDASGGRTSVVRSAVATIARVDVTQLRDETRLLADLGFDSLMTMELMVALEGPAEGRLGPATLAGLTTIGDIERALAVSAAATPVRLDDQDDAAGRRSPLTRLPGPVQDVAKGLVSEAQRRFYGDVMRTRVTGRAFIPQNRNCIVVANHTIHLDMGLVWYALGTYGEDLVALAARDYFFEKNPVQRAVLENFTNLAPLDRHAGLKETLREIGKLLDSGKTVLIFPEGTRSTDGTIREFKGAVGHLALKHGIDILPVFLGGAYEAMPKSSRLPRKRDLLAKIGPPLTPADLHRVTVGLKPAAAARRVAELSQRAVEALRDGGVLDLSRLSAEETEPGGPKKHPLIVLFEDLEKRFVPGKIKDPVSFYFTLGSDVESKWTVKVSPTACSVEMKKPENGVADCVLKTSPDIFTRIVREGFMPGIPEFISGQIKSNDVSLLETFVKAFHLG